MTRDNVSCPLKSGLMLCMHPFSRKLIQNIVGIVGLPTIIKHPKTVQKIFTSFLINLLNRYLFLKNELNFENERNSFIKSVGQQHNIIIKGIYTKTERKNTCVYTILVGKKANN